MEIFLGAKIVLKTFDANNDGNMKIKMCSKTGKG